MSFSVKVNLNDGGTSFDCCQYERGKAAGYTPEDGCSKRVMEVVEGIKRMVNTSPDCRSDSLFHQKVIPAFELTPEEVGRVKEDCRYQDILLWLKKENLVCGNVASTTKIQGVLREVQRMLRNILED